MNHSISQGINPVKAKSDTSIENFVLFAGAGCSMAPPSSLPDWKQLNDSMLEVLWDRLEPYGLHDKYRKEIIASIRQRRDDNRFPPDYQAQLMEERVGIRYFQLLSAVDSDTYNAVQYYAAHLAKQGKLNAVLTTNFDQNFERAFREHGVDFNVYSDELGFNTMRFDAIPVLKIHGCSSNPSSMVDTSKQRLQGRSKALELAVSRLLEQYPFLICGFSGADFDENPNYLGFRDAAPLAKGLTYLCLPGRKVRDSMRELLHFYGIEKSSVIEADPALYLEQLVSSHESPVKPFSAAETSFSFRNKLVEKAAEIDPMDCFNMLVALVESYGDEVTARYLYDKIWKQRLASDYEGESISRFLLNHGRSYVFNFQDKKERAEAAGVQIGQHFLGEIPPGQEDAFTNPAMMNLKHVKNNAHESFALIALVQTYNSNPILFHDFPASLQTQITGASPAERADIFYYYSIYALHCHHFDEGISLLELAIQEMEKEQDEPRLSRLLSRYSMFLSRVEETDSAIASADRALSLALACHEQAHIAQAFMAQAVIDRKAGKMQDALQHIQQAVEMFSFLRRFPEYFEALLEYLKILFAALGEDARNDEAYFRMLNDILGNVEKNLVGRVPLFEPEYCYLVGMILHHYGKPGASLEWFVDAVSLAEQFEQHANLAYFRETCLQLNILEAVDNAIQLHNN